MELHAFELSSDYTLDELVGASVAYGPDTHLFDIKAHLMEGNGMIVTDDPLLVGILSTNDLLQGAQVPPKAEAVVLPGQAEATPPAPTLYEPQTPTNPSPVSVPSSPAAASPADVPAEEARAVEDKVREQAGISQETAEESGQKEERTSQSTPPRSAR